MAAPYGEYPLVQIGVEVGVATREYTCQFPYGIIITRSYGSADGANGTDRFTPTVTVGGVVIKTCTTVNAADTIFEDVGVDATASPFIPANTPFKVVLTVSGTAANINGFRFVLLGSVKR